MSRISYQQNGNESKLGIIERGSPNFEGKVGYGRATGHYGELFQGQIADRNGKMRRCLVSLPCESLFSNVTVYATDTGVIEVEPSYKEKTRRAVELTFAYLNAHISGGVVRVVSNVEERKGKGSSTADCVAGSVAAADSLGKKLSPEEIASLVVKAEQASDNTMFSKAVLFAHREGVVLEDYAYPFPELEALGIDTDLNGYVDTISYPPAVYSRRELESFHVLTRALRRAIKTQDVQLLGRVSTASAVINERFLPKPQFAEIRCLAERAGALGVAVAHSGTVVSVLLDPRDNLLGPKVELLQTELSKIGINSILRFHTKHNHI